MAKGRPVGLPKTGGREPGSKNKLTNEIKVRLTDIVATYVLTSDGVRNLEADLATLRPVDRVTMIEKLMKFCIPTLGSMSMKDEDTGEPVTINVKYVQAKPKIDDDFSDQDYSEDVPE